MPESDAKQILHEIEKLGVGVSGLDQRHAELILLIGQNNEAMIRKVGALADRVSRLEQHLPTAKTRRKKVA